MSQVEFPGDRLRARREEQGFSIEEAHSHTHIPVPYLEALENGNVRALPVDAYALGFLKTYCQFLELAPEPFVDRFHVCPHPSFASRLRAVGSGDQRNRQASTGPSLWAQELLAWGAICALLLLGWFTYTVVVRPLAESRSPVEASTEDGAPPAHFDDAF